MNKQRRNRIISIIGLLEEIRDEEQEYFDNMPENLQCSENADRSSEAIDELEIAMDSLENII